ncbi:MAG: hypothetical protein M3R55_12045 [Acidobacteriota bacterium]|nr:hypothetical protein [Acidobacteriota bacterium]
MKRLTQPIVFLAAAAVVALVYASLSAHNVQHTGTVLTVAANKLEITSVNKTSKKDETVAFVIDRNTKVKRGEKLVAYADAKITKGEKIVVVVNADARVRMLATELRLAAQ